MDSEKTVGQMVAENPEAARVFERAGIDYCCGGQRSLDQACKSSMMSPAEVTGLLEKAAAARTSADRNWSSASQSELVHHIIHKHHAYVRQELPRLEALLLKVQDAHVAGRPELAEMAAIFHGLSEELDAHMMKEEKILFPYIEELELAAQGRGERPVSMFGTVRNPVRMMMMEHDAAGANVRSLRQLSRDYAVPPDACASYRALYEGMAAFEADLHQHIHLENNVLFPRAIEMEAQ